MGRLSKLFLKTFNRAKYREEAKFRDWCSYKGASRNLQLRALELSILADRFLPAPREGQVVFCVGCKSGMELDIVEETCGVKTKGLDLHSQDPRIEVGSMEKMSFADNSFDAGISAYSLHHAHDVKGAIGEFMRVLKPGGLIIIEVPTQFADEATCTNLKGNLKTDVKSTKTLLEYMGVAVEQVLWREDRRCRSNPQLIARLITKIKK